MEVRMFANNGNTDELEKEINVWLSRSKVKVIDIKQSYTCDAKTCYALISVWFESLEAVNQI
jgi:hypothetical protein